jgi:hypothetical protein
MHEKDTIRIDDDLLISRAEFESLARRFHIRRASLFGSA